MKIPEIDRGLINASFNILKHKDIDLLNGPYLPSNRRLHKIADQLDVDFVGQGSECFVLASRKTGEQDKVLAVDWRGRINDESAKSIYHRQHLLSSLFPHSFPKFLAVLKISDGENYAWASVRQRVHGELRNRLLWHGSGNFSHIDRKSVYPFIDTWQTIKRLDLPFIVPDKGSDNFIFGKDGGVYYVDVLRLDYERSGIWDSVKIVDYMKTQGSSDKEIRSVLKSVGILTRLSKLRYDWIPTST